MAKSEFLSRYKKEMQSILKDMHPSFTKDRIDETVKEMVHESMMNPEVTLDNNYTGERKTSTLLSVFDWTYDRKPLIAGNGTFYVNQYEGLNPVATMLDGMLARRKMFKKRMFKVENTASDEYKNLDRSQANEKINCNSYYGASGAPSSAFYSTWSGPATTNSAQQVISTCENLFEAFCVDNYNFLDLNELLHWCEVVLEQEKDTTLDEFVTLHTVDEVHERLYEKIITTESSDDEILHAYLEHLNSSELTILYYKNNLIQFMKDHDEPRDIIERILESTLNLSMVDVKDNLWLEKIPEEYVDEFSGKTPKEWNKMCQNKAFMDPNAVPSEIEADVKALCDMLTKYIYVRYMAFDRVYRLKNFKRGVVTVIDTDSNILALDTVINYILDEIVKDRTYGREKEMNIFILINTITYTLTHVVTDILLSYGEHSNIPEEYRPRYNMKNEFYFSRLIIGLTKKRYISKIILREGNLMNPAKIDIKGFDFKKATCSEYAEEVFTGIIKRNIIEAPEISVAAIYREYKAFKDEVLTSLKNRERRFLPNGNVKDLSAYADPGKIQSVRAFLAWNMINPDNLIEPPTKVSLLKLNLFTEEDCEPLKHSHPEIYERIINGIFNDTSGIFVRITREKTLVEPVNPKKKEWWKDIPKKYQAKYKKLGVTAWNAFAENYVPTSEEEKSGRDKIVKHSKGLQVLAIPSNSEIPEWCLPYIDYDTVVNTILAPFNPVLELFRSQFNEVGKTVNGVSRKSKSLSNIVKF